jgi:ribonuclease R
MIPKMIGFEELIQQQVSDTKYRPVKTRELARKLQISQKDYPVFRRTVKDMIDSGKLAEIRGNRIVMPPKMVTLIGVLSRTKSGRAFVKPDDGSADIEIDRLRDLGGIDGDKVEVRITEKHENEQRVGEIIKIVEARTTQIVGTYQHTRYATFVKPDDRRLKVTVSVSPPKGITVTDGAKVVVLLTPADDPRIQLNGKIIEVLGMPGDPGVDVLSIIHQFNLPTSFPRAVSTEAEAIPKAIPSDEIGRRRDYRNAVVFTIDPVDAKDHDDAVSLEATDSGYRLGVHIADVSYYVREHSHLDKEARNRTSSAYLVDRVLPMLPERLSNDLCSLRENEDRLTMSAIIELDRSGRVIGQKLEESIIRSQAKLSYEQVQNFLDTGTGFEHNRSIADTLKLMEELAQKLISNRMLSGSIDFEVAEYKIELDDKGWATHVVRRERKLSNRIIEEFMLLANKTVASVLLAKNIPVLYRVHPSPNPEKLASFINFAANFGHRVSFGLPPQPKFIADFIAGLHGKDEQEILNELLIRSMQKAYYQPENIGHFGLAFASYLHFTSPIRRYPDLIVHRILRQVLRGENNPAKGAALKSSLTRTGKHCSEQEIVIMQAERETLAIKQAEFLSRQLGEVYDGVISGMLKFGFFARIVDVGAEGMVRLSTLEDDFYTADLEKFEVIGRRSHRSLRLGDKIKVQVVRVSLESGEIDLRLVEDTRPAKRGSKPTRTPRTRTRTIPAPRKRRRR